MNHLKKFLLFFVCFNILTIPNVSASLEDTYPYFNTIDLEIESVGADHILLYNLKDDKVVYQKKNEEKMAMASLTKIMTALLAIEKNENLDKKVIVMNEAFYNITGYAEAGFQVGDVVTIRDLLYGALLPSGVEAAQALAILTSGSINQFVVEMNEMATKLGLDDTHYSNPVGRDEEENYSTLNDLAKLLLYALENETFYEIYTTREYETTNHLQLLSTLVLPSDKYKLNIDSIIGSKSGYTNNAGLCLSSIAEYEGVKYLLITAHSPYANGFPNHIVDSLKIYDYFSKKYSYQNILSKGQVLTTLKIKDGYLDTYPVTSDQEKEMYFDSTMLEELKYNYTGIETIDNKIKKGDFLGNVEIVYKDEVLYTYEVYLNEVIKFKYTNIKIISISVIFIFCILILIYIIKRKRKSKIKS